MRPTSSNLVGDQPQTPMRTYVLVADRRADQHRAVVAGPLASRRVVNAKEWRFGMSKKLLHRKMGQGLSFQGSAVDPYCLAPKTFQCLENTVVLRFGNLTFGFWRMVNRFG